MSDHETQESQGEQESYTSGGVTYVGPTRSRYGRLHDAVDEFRRQADWLSGYLFIVGEHFEGGRRDVTEQAVLSYLDAVPGVVTDLGAALEDVEHLAEELRRVMAGEELGGRRPLRLQCVADVTPKVNQGRERNYRRGYVHGWLAGLDAMRLLLRARQTVRAAYRACANFSAGELSAWRYSDCTKQEQPPTFTPDGEGPLPLPE